MKQNQIPLDRWLESLAAGHPFHEDPELPNLTWREPTKEERIHNNRVHHLVNLILTIPVESWTEYLEEGEDGYESPIIEASHAGKGIRIYGDFTALYVEGGYVLLNMLESWRVEALYQDVRDAKSTAGIEPTRTIGF